MRRLPQKLTTVPRHRNKVLAAILVVLLAGGVWVALAHRGTGPPGPPAAAPGAPPAGPPAAAGIDLSGWKLTLPEENEDGDIAQVTPATARAPWMVVQPDGALNFWAPSVGATTKHSDHPRTELNSLTNFRAGQGVHELRASVTVIQEPRDGQGIIVGQIHGAGDVSSVPYVMVRYQDHGLKAVVKQVQDGEEHINYQLLRNLPLNTRFDFTITDPGDGNLAFTATAPGQVGRQVVPIPSEFRGATVRFQAGDYQQADDPEGKQDGGRVVFHALDQSSTAP